MLAIWPIVAATAAYQRCRSSMPGAAVSQHFAQHENASFLSGRRNFLSKSNVEASIFYTQAFLFQLDEKYTRHFQQELRSSLLYSRHVKGNLELVNECLLSSASLQVQD